MRTHLVKEVNAHGLPVEYGKRTIGEREYDVDAAEDLVFCALECTQTQVFLERAESLPRTDGSRVLDSVDLATLESKLLSRRAITRKPAARARDADECQRDEGAPE